MGDPRVETGGRLSTGDLAGQKEVRGRSELGSPRKDHTRSRGFPVGGEGISLKVPEGFPPPLQGLYALEPFDVRPFVPSDDLKKSCESDVPAGEVATAWLEWSGEGEGLRLEADLPAGLPKGAGLTIRRLDFWWQAGRRVEQDAYFPARVAAGEGDVFVAERLFSQEAQGLACIRGDKICYVISWRVPKTARPGSIALPIRMKAGNRVVGELTWRISVTPLLPASNFLTGIYYLTKDPSRWDADLADIAEHGFTAVTCPAESEDAWLRFKALASKYGLDGRFALYPHALTPEPGDWAYVCDEPGTADALKQAEARAESLAQKGWKTWGALCWRPLGRSPELLDECSMAPNLTAEGGHLPKPKGASWTYIQGLREDPAYNIAQMGRDAFERGLAGVWVFCYRPEPEGRADDWKDLPLRYDACVMPGPSGSLATVEWEALRQGILEGRLLRSGRTH